VVAKLLLYRSF